LEPDPTQPCPVAPDARLCRRGRRTAGPRCAGARGEDGAQRGAAQPPDRAAVYCAGARNWQHACWAVPAASQLGAALCVPVQAVQGVWAGGHLPGCAAWCGLAGIPSASICTAPLTSILGAGLHQARALTLTLFAHCPLCLLLAPPLACRMARAQPWTTWALSQAPSAQCARPPAAQSPGSTRSGGGFSKP
jgi:hypothetical protein